MSREVLFRGKRVDNGEWETGYYVLDDKGRAWLFSGNVFYGTDHDIVEVIPSTVGQYTGLTDKNGRKIFEGDVLEKQGYWSQVVEFHRIMPLNSVQYNNSKGISINGYDSTSWEVIGNIHDNSELKGD